MAACLGDAQTASPGVVIRRGKWGCSPFPEEQAACLGGREPAPPIFLFRTRKTEFQIP
jgi:hypothetical protein